MKKFLFIILIIFNLSCISNKSNSYIDLDKEDNISIYDLVDSISVVQLETNKESLIRSGETYFYKNRFYIFDRSQQIVFCFDKQGKFLFRINKRGRGADEYNYAETFAIDPFSDYLMFLVPWGSLVCYDLDGNFISKTGLPNSIRAYSDVKAVDKDKLLFFTFANEFNVYYYSRNLGTIKGCLATTELHSYVFPSYSQSYYFKDSIYFFNAGIKNDLLNMTDTNQRVVFQWKYGDNDYTESQIEHLLSLKKQANEHHRSGNIRKETIGKNNYPQFYTFVHYETERFIIQILMYQNWGNTLNVFIDKQLEKGYVFKNTIEGICFDRSCFFNKRYCFSSQNFTPQIKTILSTEQLKIIESHNPDTDNPFLVIYHLK